MSKFDKQAFEVAFASALVQIATAEKVTKEELKTLSRTVLTAVHETGDIGYVNRLLEVLTPVNRKVCTEYFKHFTGFSFDDALKLFVKKSKKRYAEAVKLSEDFLTDPHNNVWTWAERNIDVGVKAFALDSVTKYVESTMKKAVANGYTQADVMRAIIKGGMTGEAVVACMDELGFDVKVTGDAPANPLETVGDALM